MTRDGDRGRGRLVLAVAGPLIAAAFIVAFRQVLGIRLRPSWPPPAGAVTSAGAERATQAFAARDGVGPRDAALDFAWSTAATIDPHVEGANFFPRILADVDAARSSVHILMFGWREGNVGTRMAELLERKLKAGVEVRVLVDGFGSRPYGKAREMFTHLAEAGAQIAVNDVFPPAHSGLFPDDRQLEWRQDEVGRSDHRKLYPRRRRRRVDRRSRARGSLRERRLPRRHGPGHRRRRAAGAGGVPHELPRPRRAAPGRRLAPTSPSRPIGARRRSPWPR